ncbi:hypothetical protein [Luteimicrobium subarcticum]|uniref:Uncharacterized protein n=1 Tax=Luteimicrobium subarcticum TaxID=620910 RepID=A0A2M8W409_9MICO|nr:hypothetical protein [Luteimicrobium subarcticum]PJI85665.1 hypothetical protein CLV34_2849 [Luteimicrobium subarcticum]
MSRATSWGAPGQQVITEPMTVFRSDPRVAADLVDGSGVPERRVGELWHRRRRSWFRGRER